MLCNNNDYLYFIQAGAKAAKAKPKGAADGKSSLTELKPWPAYIQVNIQ